MPKSVVAKSIFVMVREEYEKVTEQKSRENNVIVILTSCQTEMDRRMEIRMDRQIGQKGQTKTCFMTSFFKWSTTCLMISHTHNFRKLGGFLFLHGTIKFILVHVTSFKTEKENKGTG